MEVQWIAVGISVVALTLAGLSIFIAAKYRSRLLGQGSEILEFAAERPQQHESEFSPSREYFRQLKEQMDSARTRGALDEANALQTQYEEEMQSWRALESL